MYWRLDKGDSMYIITYVNVVADKVSSMSLSAYCKSFLFSMAY